MAENELITVVPVCELNEKAQKEIMEKVKKKSKEFQKNFKGFVEVRIG